MSNTELIQYAIGQYVHAYGHRPALLRDALDLAFVMLDDELAATDPTDPAYDLINGRMERLFSLMMTEA